MGFTHVAVKVLNSDSDHTYNADFLVDTGAMDSMAPASELKKIGMKPVGKELYEFANGEFQEYEYGLAEMRVLGQIIATNIIFGPDDTEPLLGVIALEAAGFLVDPKNQTLRKLRARRLKQVGQIAVAG